MCRDLHRQLFFLSLKLTFWVQSFQIGCIISYTEPAQLLDSTPSCFPFIVLPRHFSHPSAPHIASPSSSLSRSSRSTSYESTLPPSSADLLPTLLSMSSSTFTVALSPSKIPMFLLSAGIDDEWCHFMSGNLTTKAASPSRYVRPHVPGDSGRLTRFRLINRTLRKVRIFVCHELF